MMVSTLLAFPILGLFTLLQTVVVSRLPLLYGSADLVMVTLISWAMHDRVTTAFRWALVGGFLVSMVSGLPFMIPLWGYLVATALTRILRRHVWQIPIIAMLVVTFLSTLLIQAMSIIALQFQGTVISWKTAINEVTLPSALLNLLIALPVYAVITDLANGLYPEELEV